MSSYCEVCQGVTLEGIHPIGSTTCGRQTNNTTHRSPQRRPLSRRASPSSSCGRKGTPRNNARAEFSTTDRPQPPLRSPAATPSLSPLAPAYGDGPSPLAHDAIRDLMENIREAVRSEAEKVLSFSQQRIGEGEEKWDEQERQLRHSSTEEAGATREDTSPTSFMLNHPNYRTPQSTSPSASGQYYVVPNPPYPRQNVHPKNDIHRAPRDALYLAGDNYTNDSVGSSSNLTSDGELNGVGLSFSRDPHSARTAPPVKSPTEDAFQRQLQLQLQTQSSEQKSNLSEVRQSLADLCTAVKTDLRTLSDHLYTLEQRQQTATDSFEGYRLEQQAKWAKLHEKRNTKTVKELEEVLTHGVAAFQDGRVSSELKAQFAKSLFPYLLPSLQHEMEQRREEDREWTRVECARQLAERTADFAYRDSAPSPAVGFSSTEEWERHMRAVAQSVVAEADHRRDSRQLEADRRRTALLTQHREETELQLGQLRQALGESLKEGTQPLEDRLTALQSQLRLVQRQLTRPTPTPPPPCWNCSL